MNKSKVLKERREESHDRLSRDDESRRLQERIHELNDSFDMSWKDPYYIDPAKIPYGWEYAWMRESIRGEPDDSRMAEVKSDGWTLVPASRHPEKGFTDFLGRTSHLSGYCYHKGLVLFERPKVFGDKIRAEEEKNNLRLINGLAGTEGLQGKAGMPMKIYANPEATRGNINE